MLFWFQVELMGGSDSATIKEVTSSSVTEDQKKEQENLENDQEQAQIEMDVEHAVKVNDMKKELDSDQKMAKESIDNQMEEQKRKVNNRILSKL